MLAGRLTLFPTIIELVVLSLFAGVVLVEAMNP